MRRTATETKSQMNDAHQWPGQEVKQTGTLYKRHEHAVGGARKLRGASWTY